MNKLLCRSLALVMLVGTAVPNTAFAKADYKNEYHYDNMEDVYFYDTGAFRGESETVDYKSAEIVELVYKLGFIGYSVPKGHLKRGNYVQTLNKLSKNLTIDEDAVFNEEGTGGVTKKEAFTAMCDILGYLRLYGTEEGLKAAVGEGLSDGISYEAEEEITEGEFARLVFNSLSAEYMAAEYENGSITYYESENSLMEDRFSLYKISGLLDGVYKKSIFSSNTPNKGEVFIDGVSYMTGESGADSLFGMRVTAYVSEDDGEYTVLFAEREKKSEYAEINARDISEVNSDRIYWDDEDGREQSLSIKDIKYVVYNNDITNDFSNVLACDTYEGTISFAASKKGGKTDIAIIKDYSYLSVYSVSEYEEKIYLNYGATLNGETSIDMSKNEVLICKSGGEEKDWLEILPNDCLKVLQSSDKTYTEIEISKTKITGTVSGYDIEENTVVIDGEEYRISRSYLSAASAKTIGFGTVGTFFVSEDGYIAGYTASSELAYGYVDRVYKDEDSDQAVILLFTQLGGWENYTAREKLTVDGVEMTDAAFEGYFTTHSLDNSLIRYKVNSRGEVTEIDTLEDTVYESKDEERLVLGYTGNVTLTSSGGRYFKETQYSLFDDAVIFKIPDDLDRKEQYSVTNGASLSGSNTITYLKMYSPNSFKMCRAGIVGDAPAEIANENVYWLYVENISEGINEEDEKIYKLKGILFQNNSREYVEKYVITCTESLRTQLEVTYPGMFKKGSLMRVDYDKNNKLKSATLAFSNNACSEFYTSVYDYYNTMCGTVTAVDPTLGSWGYMNVNAVGTDYIIQPRGSILIIDTAKDKHYVGSVADVRAGDRIFVHYVAAQGRMNVIFR